MDTESTSSETNLVIITKRDRFKIFCNLYWRVIMFCTVPLVLAPVAFIGYNNAYKCFYIFLVTTIFWIADVLHPAATALVPVALTTIIGTVDEYFITQICIRNTVFKSVGVMCLMIAIQQSKIHIRVAVKLLLLIGYSHYKLSFMLFFSTMFLAMWMSNTIACGLMMPLVHAILSELERMGILDMYHSFDKTRTTSTRHEQMKPLPTDYTIFYFLGVTYSATIGTVATLVGSQANKIFKIYAETIFPESPVVEFPHIMLLNLPAVLVIEMLLYLWMNFYFLGMIRAQSETSLEIGLSDEETQYINNLLKAQYSKLGKITFHEYVVGAVTILAVVLEATVNSAYLQELHFLEYHRNIKVSSTCIACAVLLFVLPAEPNFIQFFKKHSGSPLPTAPGRACLNWDAVQKNFMWTALFITASSDALFESLEYSKFLQDVGRLLLKLQYWPKAAVPLVVILVCKFCSEFASNTCVTYCMMPYIAKLCVVSHSHPYYLMAATALSCSFPFHLSTGTPANAMVCQYVHIPPRRMLCAGLGPSVIAVLVTWFTVAVWSKAVWPDVGTIDQWLKNNTLDA